MTAKRSSLASSTPSSGGGRGGRSLGLSLQLPPLTRSSRPEESFYDSKKEGELWNDVEPAFLEAARNSSRSFDYASFPLRHFSVCLEDWARAYNHWRMAAFDFDVGSGIRPNQVKEAREKVEKGESISDLLLDTTARPIEKPEAVSRYRGPEPSVDVNTSWETRLKPEREGGRAGDTDPDQSLYRISYDRFIAGGVCKYRLLETIYINKSSKEASRTALNVTKFAKAVDKGMSVLNSNAVYNAFEARMPPAIMPPPVHFAEDYFNTHRGALSMLIPPYTAKPMSPAQVEALNPLTSESTRDVVDPELIERHAVVPTSFGPGAQKAAETLTALTHMVDSYALMHLSRVKMAEISLVEFRRFVDTLGTEGYALPQAEGPVSGPKPIDLSVLPQSFYDGVVVVPEPVRKTRRLPRAKAASPMRKKAASVRPRRTPRARQAPRAATPRPQLTAKQKHDKIAARAFDTPGCRKGPSRPNRARTPDPVFTQGDVTDLFTERFDHVFRELDSESANALDNTAFLYPSVAGLDPFVVPDAKEPFRDRWAREDAQIRSAEAKHFARTRPGYRERTDEVICPIPRSAAEFDNSELLRLLQDRQRVLQSISESNTRARREAIERLNRMRPENQKHAEELQVAERVRQAVHRWWVQSTSRGNRSRRSEGDRLRRAEPCVTRVLKIIKTGLAERDPSSTPCFVGDQPFVVDESALRANTHPDLLCWALPDLPLYCTVDEAIPPPLL